MPTAKTTAYEVPIKPPTKEAPKELKLFSRNSAEFRHDLYELDPQPCKKDGSWKTNQPMLTERVHDHIYHSHDKKGRANDYCSPSLGHFHKIMTHDEQGNPYVSSDGHPEPRCGPPLKIVYDKLPSGPRKRISTIQFKDDRQVDQQGNSLVIKDQHIHKVIYRGSEMLSEHKRQAQVAKDAEKLAQLQSAKPAAIS